MFSKRLKGKMYTEHLVLIFGKLDTFMKEKEKEQKKTLFNKKSRKELIQKLNIIFF